MIKSFADRATEQLFQRRRVAALPPDLYGIALRKLRLLDATTRLDSLRVPPGNRLEALKGDRAGRHSIRINDQWRICFRWQDGDAYEVETLGLPQVRLPMTDDRLPPVHPGEVLQQDFLVPMGLSQYALAKAIGVPPQRVLEIVHGRRAVTADTALRLGRYFGVEPQLWLNLQTRYDLDRAEDALGDRLEREVTPRAA